MDDLKTNPNSHLTAKERDKMSFPARLLFQQGKLNGKVLDFGCGYGKDVEMLQEKGIDIQGYDKHYFPKYPQEKFDTILCLYVLNVLLPEEQTRVLLEVSHLLKPGGTAYYALRRDLKNVGFRMHKLHQQKTYQCKVVLPFQSFFLNENCEIYAFQHFNQSEIKENADCPFCNLSDQTEIITESLTVYAIADKYPVNPGHALIIPKRHVANYFELTFREQQACWFMLNYVKELMDAEFHLQGYNVGINVGTTAGQTIDHVHIHLIPRYAGDVERPLGGVRGVIPERKEYEAKD